MGSTLFQLEILDHLSCSNNSGLLYRGGLPHSAVSKMRFFGDAVLREERPGLRLLSHAWESHPGPTPCSLSLWLNEHTPFYPAASFLFGILLSLPCCCPVPLFCKRTICTSFLIFFQFQLHPSSKQRSHSVLPRARTETRQV